MRGAEWWVLGGAALAGWAVVSWLFPTRPPQGPDALRPDAPPATRPPSLPAPEAAPSARPQTAPVADATFDSVAAGAAGLSLTQIAAGWHQILGVTPDASLAEIEAAWQQRRGMADVNLAQLREAYDFARRLKG